MATVPVVLLSVAPAQAAGTTLFNQPFHNSTADGTGAVVLPALPLGGTNQACLTASGNAATGTLHSCATSNDAPGAGTLRLTDMTGGRTGGVFGATSVPTSQGLDVTFNAYQYGGGGADGLAFVAAAVDPASPTAPATLGPSGGDLGYSGTKTLSGLANGYLGVGFDPFGNFSTSTYEGTGCTDPAYVTTTKMPGQVVVRGPGRGTVGYCAIASTATNTSSPPVALRAATRAASKVPVEVVINPTASSITTASGVVAAAGTYAVVFTPVGGTPRTLAGAMPMVPTSLYPSSSWLTAGGIPRQLAFGWVGSTGSVMDFHELDNAKVVTFNPVPQLGVSAVSYNGSSPAPGDPVTYSVTASVGAGQDETAPVSVTETLPVGVVPVGAFGTGWVCQAPAGQQITCTDSNTPFTNGTSLNPITVVGIVTGSTVTPATIQTGTVSTASSTDANPGYSSTSTAAGTLPTAPSGITVTPAVGSSAGGNAVTIGGSNISGATAVEIGTTAEQQAGTPITLLPCATGVTVGCFSVNGNGTLAIASMPAHTVATTSVTVVTLGVAAAASYVYASAPAAPAAPTATAGIASATVTWTAPATNGSPLTGYTVTPYLGGVAQTPVSFDASTTTRTLSALTPGGSYTFTVAAQNAFGTGPASAASAAVVPYAVPAAPTITAVSAHDSAATLSWSAPATNGSPITGYVVTPYLGGVAQTTQTFPGTQTSASVVGLTPGATYTFTVAAINLAGTGPPSPPSSPVTINASPTLTFPAPPGGQTGVPYSDQLTVTGGTGPFTWTISAGILPPGLTLAPATGLLAGTPLTAGSYPFTVKVTDADGQIATKAVTVTVISGPLLAFPAPPAGEVSVAYSDQLTETGGTAPFTWTISVGTLPPGLTLAPTTGLLAGTPTTAGTYTFTVKITDLLLQTATENVTLTIAAAPTLAFPAPPAGQILVAYSDQLTVTGGTGPFTWSLSAGSLPPGLTLAPATGLLAGTPTLAGTYPFTVKVTDAFAKTATRPVSLVIVPGPLSITVPPSPVNLGTAPSGSTTLTGHLGVVTVIDNRGSPTAGWVTTITATAFTTGAGTTPQTVPPSMIAYSSGPATATTGTGTFTPSAPALPAVAASWTGSGVDTASWNPTLTFTFSPRQIAGIYTGTITHSVG
ncbi:MAG: putative Ig domain-containing protein [Frankia sp.]